jgi:hypothetical protein
MGASSVRERTMSTRVREPGKWLPKYESRRLKDVIVVQVFAAVGGYSVTSAGRRKARRGLRAVRGADRPGSPLQSRGGARRGLRKRREADQRRAAQEPPDGGAAI